jgi:precorrin-2 dehydrogenase/sirohydrochlorin ferrochelatase
VTDRESLSERGNVVLYPIFLDLSGRRCVVVGGGEVANRKARKLLQARARVVVISPELGAELESVAVEIHRRPYRAAVAQEAKERGVPVNVADKPSEGDFALPSTLRRGRLQVAVSTGGASPTLARRIRDELEKAFGPEWAGIVERLNAARRHGEAGDERLEGEVSRCLSRLRG